GAAAEGQGAAQGGFRLQGQAWRARQAGGRDDLGEREVRGARRDSAHHPGDDLALRGLRRGRGRRIRRGFHLQASVQVYWHDRESSDRSQVKARYSGSRTKVQFRAAGSLATLGRGNNTETPPCVSSQP